MRPCIWSFCHFFRLASNKETSMPSQRARPRHVRHCEVIYDEMSLFKFSLNLFFVFTMIGKVTSSHLGDTRDTETGDPARLPGLWGLIKRKSKFMRRGKYYFVLGLLEQPGQDKNVLYCHDEPNGPFKEGSLLSTLPESPFASASTVSREGGHTFWSHWMAHKVIVCQFFLL
jgi:hypothetical protein